MVFIEEHSMMILADIASDVFSQVVINAEATTVSTYSSTTPTQADPQSEFLCKAFLPLCFR